MMMMIKFDAEMELLAKGKAGLVSDLTVPDTLVQARKLTSL